MQPPYQAPLFSTLDYDDTLVSLLGVFEEQLKGSLAGIADSLEQGHQEAASRLAHRSCGTAATYGFPDLARQFAAFEQAAGPGGNLSELKLQFKAIQMIAGRIFQGIESRSK